MFQTVFSTYSQSTQYTDSFDTNGSYFDGDDAPVADLSPHFYGGSTTPFNSSADADLCGLPVSSNEDDGEGRYAMVVPYNGNPAQPVTLQPPISVEYPDSDTEDFSTSISSYQDAFNQINGSIQNVNVNFEFNEASINTVATVNHDVQVDEQIIGSTAVVVHHNVEVDELVQNSVATVENHFIDIDEQTHHTTANVTHHEVEVEENLISTVANVESNLVEVKTKTLKSIANVEDHELDIRRNTIQTVSNVDNHEINVNMNTIETTANVGNHEIQYQILPL